MTHFLHTKDALSHNSPLRGGMHRRTHSRTPSTQHTPAHVYTGSPPVEMDSEAANKRRRL